ncbi:hypothetical protein, partial [Acinetobacter baumannii]|uniref:hypothetical protein n=1 Tax=Acinetobacter baumannii TaxID=470 RepID=UPI00249ADB49
MSCSNSKAVNIVDELRSARNNISVYKTEVSGISSDIDKIVIVVEGKDDPGVYRVWPVSYTHLRAHETYLLISY